VRVLLFGASGMVGQGVLLECLHDSEVTETVAVVREPLQRRDDTLREIVHKNLFDLTAVQNQLTGFDACFFCIGVSSFRMK